MTSDSSLPPSNSKIHLSFSVISSLLTEICEESKLSSFSHSNSHSKLLNCFFLESIPEVPLHKYLLRLISYTQIEQSTLVIMLIYIDKLCSRYKLQLTYYNIYKIIVGAVLLAIKYNEDNYLSLDYYSKVCGLQTKEIKRIEYIMMRLFDFNVYIDDKLYWRYEKNITTIGKEYSVIGNSNSNNTT